MTAAAVRRPAVAIGALLCIFGFEQMVQSQAAFFTVYPWLGNAAVVLPLMTGVAVRFYRGRLPLRPLPGVAKVVLLLYLFTTLSALWAVFPAESLYRLQEAAPYILATVLLPPLLIYEPRDVRDALYGLLSVGALVLVLVALTGQWEQRFLQLAQSEIVGLSRAGEGGNPLAIASMGAYVLVAAILMNFRGKARVWQLLRWAVVLLAVIVIVRSGSRGQLFAPLVTVLLLLPLSRRLRSFRGLAAALGAGVIVVAVTFLVFQNVTIEEARWDPQGMVDTYVRSRMLVAGEALAYWSDAGPMRWVLGLGVAACRDPSVIGTYPHVVPVEVLVEEGFIGLLLFAAVPVLVLRSMWRAWSAVRDYPEARGVLVAVVGLMVNDLILSLKSSTLLSINGFFLAALMVGFFETAVRRHTAAATPMVAPPPAAAEAAWLTPQPRA